MTDFSAFYSDGKTAARRPVGLRIADETVDIIATDALDNPIAQWPRSAVRLRDDPAQIRRSGVVILAYGTEQVRLASTADLERLRPALPGLTRPDPKTQLERRATLQWLGGIAASLAGLYFILPLLAAWGAGFVPLSWQREMGARAEAELTNALNRGSPATVCADTENNDLARRAAVALAEVAQLPEAPSIRVYRIPLPNAFALPGNRIVLTQGMLQRMQTPDQALAVLAHEAAHLAHADPLASVIQHQGWGLAAQVLFGTGVLSNVAQVLPIFAYHRDLERRADAEGARYLAALGRPPQSLAEALKRLAGNDGGGWLSTHPGTDERAAALAALELPVSPHAPLTASPTEWRQLRAVCGISP
ncbi:M48 family metallopeptidase [Elstera sp.]|jgi:Zn-dependent protease with chaperone function|uniref:M48 family metallopeptidase n=1 Tax=Elstera sp. TaxID=1916664 RepID=UPI0037BF2C81